MVLWFWRFIENWTSVSGGAHEEPVYSGHRTMGSAGPRPHGARTRPRPCCPPRLEDRWSSQNTNMRWNKDKIKYSSNRNRNPLNKKKWNSSIIIFSFSVWPNAATLWLTSAVIRWSITINSEFKDGLRTHTSHDPLVGDGGDQVGVCLGAGVALWLHHVVGVLEGSKRPAGQTW